MNVIHGHDCRKWWGNELRAAEPCTCGADRQLIHSSEGIAIEPAGARYFEELSADYRAKRPVWREVTEEAYDDALNALPPKNWHAGAFLLGEPYTDDERGTIYAGFARLGGHYYARYVPARYFRPMLAELAGVAP